jgi:Kelch motif
LLFIPLLLGCFGLWASPNASEVNPPRPGGYPEGPICSPPSWNAGPDLPSPGVRSVGVYFNGKFYAMGGRSSDSAGSDFTHPFEYDPNTNTWTTKAATYPDNQVNNMACAVLVANNTGYIYCVGGSAAGAATATARVFRYNPVTDMIETLDAQDNWPGNSSGTILPGGFALWSPPLAGFNTMYILGGFDINVGSTSQIWEFNQNAGIGAKWTQKVNTPVGIMYAPTCSIHGIICVAGASDFQGGVVVDTTNSFSFDPLTNTIGTIAAIPRATGETRALSLTERSGQQKMLVMGGGRTAPNPSNEVDIYDPGTNTWTTGSPVPAFTTARRNFPTDTDGTTRIWLAGGYDSTGVPVASMEIFCQGAGTPTPTPTATATATATAAVTPRFTPLPRPRPTPAPRP